MIPVLNREQMRAFDAHAIDDCGVPSIVLMENAGRGATERLLEALGERSGQVVVLCGPGNNGGDGFVVARRLLSLGREPRVFLTAPHQKLSGDARANYDAWRGLGGAVEEIATEGEVAKLDSALAGAAAVVDALLGTGLDRDVEGRLASIIEKVNQSSALRFAIDIPSGLHADTGKVLGVAVQAHATATFAHHKQGLLTSSAADHTGTLWVVDIGVPPGLYRQVGNSGWLLEKSDVAACLQRRSVATHKGSAGRVFAVAGSAGKTGAALLVARGALRAGAGLVTIATFPEAADRLDYRVLEAMTARIDPGRVADSLDELLAPVDALAIGPGLGLGEDARAVVDHVVLNWDGTKVVDADALSHFAGRAGELAKAPGKLVLTPHPGELGRLLGCSAGDVEADRFGALARAVELTGAVVLLKGPRTLVGAPGELPVVQLTQCPALATGGAGDVLSGVVAALACRLPPRQAAFVAAHLHGTAAEAWASTHGADRGLLAHEVADALPGVIARYL